MKVEAGRQGQGREPVGKYVQYIFTVGLMLFIVSHTKSIANYFHYMFRAC